MSVNLTICTGKKKTYFVLVFAGLPTPNQKWKPWLSTYKSRNQSVLWPNMDVRTLACVGKWPQSNFWNHLSSGLVQKTTVLCILQKSLLIDFIYIEQAQWLMPETTVSWGWVVLIYFCFSRHPGLISVLGTFEWDCAVADNHMVSTGLFPHIS